MMKLTRSIWMVPVIALLFTACGPEVEDPFTDPVSGEVIVEDPAFFVEGNKNGEAFSIQAGSGDYILTTSTSSENGYVEFNSNFESTLSLEKFTLMLTDYKLTTDTAFYADSSFGEGEYAFFDYQLTASTGVQFILQGEQPEFTQAHWDFGDGNTSQDFYPYHVYSSIGVYEVKLEIEDDFGCTSSFTQEVHVGVENCTPQFSYELYVDWQDPLVYTFGFELFNVDPGNVASITWDFGDGNTSSELSPMHQYTQDGKYTVCVTVERQDGCTSSYCQPVNTTSSNCAATMLYINEFSQLLLSSVSIIWEDAEGNVFDSFFVDQDQEAYFRITDMAYFGEDPYGQETYKISFELNCTLQDPLSGELIDFEDVKGTMAFAIPE